MRLDCEQQVSAICGTSPTSGMEQPSDQVDRPCIERRKAFRFEFVTGRSTGLFTKLIGGAAALMLLALPLVFRWWCSRCWRSVLGLLLWLAWVRRQAVRARPSTFPWGRGGERFVSGGVEALLTIALGLVPAWALSLS